MTHHTHRPSDGSKRPATGRRDDDLPIVHFVSGFLGGGKTTAIVGACRHLAAAGVRTAVVTNDQGSRQVDEAFARSSGIPAVGVSNGCLCCRYDDFEERLLGLADEARPEVIFAESVGSCADIVATVVKPFAAFRAAHRPRGLLSTFVDIRMVEARLSGVRLPFSDNVLYIFDKQLEEADLIVVNKRDRYDAERGEAVLALVRNRYPESEVLLHSAFEESDLKRWLAVLNRGMDRTTGNATRGAEGEKKRSEGPPTEASAVASGTAGRAPLALDYGRYGAGELEMAWLDEEIVIDGEVAASLVSKFFSSLIHRVRDEGGIVGHLKCHIATGDAGHKLSWTAGDAVERGSAAAVEENALADAGVERLRAPVRITVNVRAVASPEALERAADGAATLFTDAGIAVRSTGREVFRPGYPEPVHRMA